MKKTPRYRRWQRRLGAIALVLLGWVGGRVTAGVDRSLGAAAEDQRRVDDSYVRLGVALERLNQSCFPWIEIALRDETPIDTSSARIATVWPVVESLSLTAPDSLPAVVNAAMELLSHDPELARLSLELDQNLRRAKGTSTHPALMIPQTVPTSGSFALTLMNRPLAMYSLAGDPTATQARLDTIARQVYALRTCSNIGDIIARMPGYSERVSGDSAVGR